MVIYSEKILEFSTRTKKFGKNCFRVCRERNREIVIFFQSQQERKTSRKEEKCRRKKFDHTDDKFLKIIQGVAIRYSESASPTIQPHGGGWYQNVVVLDLPITILLFVIAKTHGKINEIL